MGKRSIRYICAILMTLVSVALTWAVMNLDIGVAGQTQTEVGLISINEPFNTMLGGVNATCYYISKYAGYASFIIVAAFALVGLVQLIKRKSLFKVDREIICMGFLYIVTLAMYYEFSKIPITLRPAISPDEMQLEPSFPSSHSMLAIVVCVSALLVIKKYISNKVLLNIARVLLVLLATVSLVTRTLSGIHWISDIIAGVVFAITLVLWYSAVICKKDIKKSINNNIETGNYYSGGKHYKK